MKLLLPRRIGGAVNSADRPIRHNSVYAETTNRQRRPLNVAEVKDVKDLGFFIEAVLTFVGTQVISQQSKHTGD